MLGLFSTVSIASIDTTIIATTIGAIASDLNGLKEINWVSTAYLLTSNGFQLLYGKLSDIFGRKPTIIFALVVFLIGSILCSISQSITMLIISRAIAGIGGGGLITLCSIIISDLVPIHKRGVYMGILTIATTVSSTLGSILGGIFVNKLSWRWCFYINLPFCFIAIVCIGVFFRFPSNRGNLKQNLKRIDYLGSTFLLGFTILLTLGLNWGGQDYPWSSAPVLVPLILSFVSLAVFVYTQWKVSKEPIIPGHLLVPNVIISCTVTFSISAVFFAIIIYMPLYFQLYYHESARLSTIGILPLISGLIIFAIGSSAFILKTKIYHPLTILGTIVGLVGIILLGIFMSNEITRVQFYIFSAILGAGIGLCVETCLIASQAAVDKKDVAITTSLIEFVFYFGGIIGIAVLGAVYQNVTTNSLLKYSSEVDLSQLSKNTSYISSLSPELIQKIKGCYVDGFKYFFFTGVPFLALGLISSLFLQHIPLRAEEK
ncbi:MFS general substrate transporter [Neoconidiobolus thromboides FSU 785]|nr:MFS general substrate transporter [Neoconidiobolus thromboides FSU 785]